ncbi:MAG: hypothetical protein IT377_24130 [Polyangiaceae bacterium]|nr:hypothetical protein [Polyangiaceae bacterium]
MSLAQRLVLPLLATLVGALACQDHQGTPGVAAGAGTAVPTPSPSAAAPRCVPATLVAQRGTPTLDGQLDQPVWHAARATDPFTDPRRAAVVSHTEARASWDDGSLFLALYVADDDLRATDRVRADFGSGLTIEASPDRRVRCRFGAESDCGSLGIEAAFTVDGDVDATAQEDEEWVVTLSIPWRTAASAGRPSELPVQFRRENVAGGRTISTTWAGGCGAIRLE